MPTDVLRLLRHARDDLVPGYRPVVVDSSALTQPGIGSDHGVVAEQVDVDSPLYFPVGIYAYQFQDARLALGSHVHSDDFPV